MNPNKFANQKIQELGKNLFQGEEFAQQIANKELSQPVPPPGSIPQSPYGDMNPIMNKESREAKRQERKNIRMANKGLRQARRERAKGVKEQGQENYSYDGYEKGRYNKKGDDIEYGKTPRYSKKNPPLNQNDPTLEPIKDTAPKPTPVMPIEQIPKKTYRTGYNKIVKNKTQDSYQLKDVSKPIIRQVPQKIAPFNFDDPKYRYKKGELLDADDFSEISGQSDLAAEKYSDIQEDKKGQYVTSLGKGEYFKKTYDKNFKRPTSSKHIDRWSEKEVERDTIRPRSGKAFISSWKKNK